MIADNASDKIDSVLNGLGYFLHARLSFHYIDFISMGNPQEGECVKMNTATVALKTSIGNIVCFLNLNYTLDLFCVLSIQRLKNYKHLRLRQQVS